MNPQDCNVTGFTITADDGTSQSGGNNDGWDFPDPSITTVTYTKATTSITLGGSAFLTNRGDGKIETSPTGAGMWTEVDSYTSWADDGAVGVYELAVGTYDVRLTTSDGETATSSVEVVSSSRHSALSTGIAVSPFF
jgi:hypothetical protein